MKSNRVSALLSLCSLSCKWLCNETNVEGYFHCYISSLNVGGSSDVLCFITPLSTLGFCWQMLRYGEGMPKAFMGGEILVIEYF